MHESCSTISADASVPPQLFRFRLSTRGIFFFFQVGRAGSMVGGAGRRVSGVVGGVVGLVWGGGGRDATPVQAQGEYRSDENNVVVDGDGTIY